MIHDDDLMVIEIYAKREHEKNHSALHVICRDRGKDILQLIKELREQQGKTKRAEEAYANLVADLQLEKPKLAGNKPGETAGP